MENDARQILNRESVDLQRAAQERDINKEGWRGLVYVTKANPRR